MSQSAIIHKFPSHTTGLKEQRPYPPCRDACPVKTDIQGYIQLIGQGRYNEAFDIIRSVNPIASSCSLICHHPCEQACRRSDIDEPLAIRHLKRFALEKATEYRRSKRKPVPQTQKEKIAIIGSGPSGLTAANDLADKGYSVTIFEKEPVLGGMLAAAIPLYRLPREILKDDIDDVLAKGVKASVGCEIGKDVTMAELMKEYDAVLISVGLSESRSLDIPGLEGEGVLLALPFLADVAFGKKPTLGKRILVIGGGNVAIDVARSARHLGYDGVKLVCMESSEEMPAFDWEVRETVEENVTILNGWGPKRIRRKNGVIEGLETVKVKAIFDDQRRFAPTFYEDQTSFIPADTIIIAIGRKSNLSFLNGTPVQVGQRGELIWNPDTQMTGTKAIFASGELIAGPGAAIQAVASGRRAANAIQYYLEGKDIKKGLAPIRKDKIDRLPDDVRAKIEKQNREKMGMVSPEVRVQSFDQIEIGYNETAALTEARRCRSCGAGAVVIEGECCSCLTCVRICPYEAPIVRHRAQIIPEKCQACGLCASECPSRAIRMVAYDVNEIITCMPKIIGSIPPDRKEPILVAFQCGYHVYGDENPYPLPDNVRQIRVHCASRIGVLELLKAFECGADGVYVTMCSAADCKFETISTFVKNRIAYTKQLLNSIGLGEDRLAYFESGKNPAEIWKKGAEEMMERVGRLKKLG